jgi:hypothetical protein
MVANDDENKRKDVSAIDALKSDQPSEAPAKAPKIVLPPEALKLVGVAESTNQLSNLPAGITVASAPSAVTKTEGTVADSFGAASELNKDVANRSLQPIAPPAETAPAPVATPMLARREQEKNSEAQKQQTFAAAPTAARYKSAEFDAIAQLPAASQVYNRMDNAANEKRAPGLANVPAPVLTSFRLEQNGRDLRVVDADGSVYTGLVQVAGQESAAPPTSGGALKSKPPTALPIKTSPQSAAQNYFFSVAGTNRNLKQNVVFSGNLIPLTNFPSFHSNAGSFGGAARTGRTAPVMPEPSLLSNSRISGKAVIGNEKEIEVNATPAP